MSERRASGSLTPATTPAFARLTPRQLEYAMLRAKGLTTVATAQEMGLSLSAAKQHGSAVMAKLGVGGMIEAFHVLGWMRPPTLAELAEQRLADLRRQVEAEEDALAAMVAG